MANLQHNDRKRRNESRTSSTINATRNRLISNTASSTSTNFTKWSTSRKLVGITQDYLCSPSANIYNIEFTRFKIRDLDTEQILFEIEKPEDNNQENVGQTHPNYNHHHQNIQQQQRQQSEGRYVRYRFSAEFLKLRHVGATVEFAVGSRPIHKFRMIERHFFKDRMLKCFDFEFGFCIPNSRNNCEHIYEFPQLSQALMDEMINNPYETRSDSFYFVDDKLVMHNKADYAYDG
ncbi:unnamed protein product [Caenorhabditis angaria]|uniref:GMP phosphodiesterase delta subunit domain-containing protein n=1 Tax=Caenorhabditis angaria TaxID=860376 RepID=A0A9P1MZK9_9PELO|nr:unnamed protein product [Caenorhabditis angaria]